MKIHGKGDFEDYPLFFKDGGGGGINWVHLEIKSTKLKKHFSLIYGEICVKNLKIHITEKEIVED